MDKTTISWVERKAQLEREEERLKNEVLITESRLREIHSEIGWLEYCLYKKEIKGN